MGLRRRVSFGFISIVGVLVLSGAVSFIELNTLSNDTDDLLGINRKYKGLTNDMMVALNDHNAAFVQMLAFNDRTYDSLCLVSLDRLDRSLVSARFESTIPEVVDSLISVSMRLHRVTDSFMTPPVYEPIYDSLLMEMVDVTDSLLSGWGYNHYQEYKPIYDEMLRSLDYFELESQIALSPGAEQLHNNAYRAVTPVLISLVVMVAIVLMLYFFMMLYCVTPVVKMNRSLRDYLAFKVPFAPKGGWRDEMQELCERIDALIKQSKNSK